MTLKKGTREQRALPPLPSLPLPNYRIISNNLYTLIICTPPFSGKKKANFRTRKNEIFILLFVQQKCKHGEVAFLMFISAKHVLLLLVSILQPGTPVKRPSLASYALRSVVRTGSRPCSLATQV